MNRTLLFSFVLNAYFASANIVIERKSKILDSNPNFVEVTVCARNSGPETLADNSLKIEESIPNFRSLVLAPPTGVQPFILKNENKASHMRIGRISYAGERGLNFEYKPVANFNGADEFVSKVSLHPIGVMAPGGYFTLRYLLFRDL